MHESNLPFPPTPGDVPGIYKRTAEITAAYFVCGSPYELYYQAGGFWNVTIRWLEGGAKESLEEMARIIGEIMPPLEREVPS